MEFACREYACNGLWGSVRNISNMAFAPSVISWMPWPGTHLITLGTNAM